MNTTTTRWDWSGPEEGDGDDTVVIMFDGEEVMTIPLRDEIYPMDRATARASRACRALNMAGAVII